MMLARICIVLGASATLAAAPVWGAGGRYGTDYPVCMEAIDGGGGTHFECSFPSMEQCRIAATGTPGTCFNNPNYVSRPTEAAPPETDPAPVTNRKKNAGRYDPDYPICIEAIDAGTGTHTECSYTSMEQCRMGAIGTPGTCFQNPYYVPPPAEPPAAQVAPAPPVKPAKPVKHAKSAKSTPPTPSAQPPQSR